MRGDGPGSERYGSDGTGEVVQSRESEGDSVIGVEFVVVVVGRLGNVIGDDDGDDLIVVGVPDGLFELTEEVEVGERLVGFPVLRDVERFHVGA